MRLSLFIILSSFLISSCKTRKLGIDRTLIPNAYNVGFLVMDGVYNTELTAPYDIFQHTQYREGIKPMNVFTVAQEDNIITTFEGLRIIPDYTFNDPKLPQIDILVIPSAEHHLDTDLNNKSMIAWVSAISTNCLYVTSHCDGAFVLAKAGLLDNNASTTFPKDIDLYKKMFPQLSVISDVLFVHDGKFITSAGGAKSFEASLYLCQEMYGKKIADQLASGLVIDWDLTKIPYLKVE